MAFDFCDSSFRREANGLRGSGAWRGLAALALACVLAVFATPPARGGTLISMDTTLGTIEIDLFNDLSPLTVNNFLSYIDANEYASTLVHRSTSIANSGLAVIQGGGFTFNDATSQFTPIQSNNPISLVYTLDNARGTIAMARTDELDSATSQWFINTSDNSVTLNQDNNGGFAVFGWVVGPGMAVADAINNLPIGLGTVPLRNNPPSNPLAREDLVFTNNIVRVTTHPSFQNPLVDTDVNNDGQTTPNDVVVIVNSLLANGSHEASAEFVGNEYKYFDTNGDGLVRPSDLLKVANFILSRPSAAPASAGFAAPMHVVPEPSSLSLAMGAALALSAVAIARRRRRKRSAAGISV